MILNNLVSSSIWQAPDHVRLVWVALRCMVDKNGEVAASLPGLAHLSRVPLPLCQEAINVLLAPDPHSDHQEHEGRRIVEICGGWRLLDHEHYRRIQSRTARAESEAERKLIGRKAAQLLAKQSIPAHDGQNTPTGEPLARPPAAPPARASESEIRMGERDLRTERKEAEKREREGDLRSEKESGIVDLSVLEPEERERSERDQRSESDARSARGEVDAERVRGEKESPEPVESTPRVGPLRSLADALKLEPQARARRVIANSFDADYAEPANWPEIKAISAAIASSLGLSVPRFGGFSRDSGLRALVYALADGYSEEDLKTAGLMAAKDPYFAPTTGKRPGFSAFTPEVLRRLLDSSARAQPPTSLTHKNPDDYAAKLANLGKSVERARQDCANFPGREDLEAVLTAANKSLSDLQSYAKSNGADHV